jgi:hypothetical protein
MWQNESTRAEFRLRLGVLCETLGDEKRDQRDIDWHYRKTKDRPHQFDEVTSAVLHVCAFGTEE